MWRWGRSYYYNGYYRLFRFRVGLGWYDLRLGRFAPGSQTIFVKDVDVHPEYFRYKVGKIYVPNDIAVLTLEKCATITKTVQIIPLAVRGSFVNQRCSLTGWGVNRRDIDNRFILQRTETTIISNKLCRDFWRLARSSISKKQLCTLDWPYKLSTACSGDSGSPLVCDGKFVGIVSWGLTYCNGCFPDVFTRVSSFTDWIHKIELKH
ncbi:chymotrypsin-like serine proteinase [Aplysia californica]|uniref:Chymotrypsin-like serine proteinase n=1 Tax=Aplysia californica TaxID=6500 RepID=A0ABM1A2M3_APLCA|nr:chymotrypsin-like serine proteinase [Aplysia californica]